MVGLKRGDEVSSGNADAPSIETALKDIRDRNNPAEKVVRIVTSSPDAPAFKEIWSRVSRQNMNGVSLRIVFTQLKKKDAAGIIADMSRQFGLGGADASVRYSRIRRASELSESVQIGESTLWMGDQSAEPSSIDLHPLDVDESRDAIEHFELIWDFSDKLPRSVVKQAAKQADRIASRSAA